MRKRSIPINVMRRANENYRLTSDDLSAPAKPGGRESHQNQIERCLNSAVSTLVSGCFRNLIFCLEMICCLPHFIRIKADELPLSRQWDRTKST
jgi:hypothetical protein